MSKIKTRVSCRGFSTTYVDIRGHKFVCTVAISNTDGGSAPRVWIGSSDKCLSKHDSRYAPAVRIALSAVYRIDLTV